MPGSYLRLSAGRVEMTDEAQALCFFAGANSIFAGDKLLTQKNNGECRDRALMEKLGMKFTERSAVADGVFYASDAPKREPQHRSTHLVVAN